MYEASANVAVSIKINQALCVLFERELFGTGFSGRYIRVRVASPGKFIGQFTFVTLASASNTRLLQTIICLRGALDEVVRITSRHCSLMSW